MINKTLYIISFLVFLKKTPAGAQSGPIKAETVYFGHHGHIK